MQHVETHQDSRTTLAGWRIYALRPGTEANQMSPPLTPSAWTDVFSGARALGFNAVCVPFEALTEKESKAQCLRACRDSGQHFMVDVQLGLPDWRQVLSSVHALLDVDLLQDQQHAVLLRGFPGLNGKDYREILTGLRGRHGQALLTVWGPGMTPQQLAMLEGLPVDGVCSSLAWWDYRDAWLVEEYERLRAVAQVIAPLADPRAQPAPHTNKQDVACRLAVASLAGGGTGARVASTASAEGRAGRLHLPCGADGAGRAWLAAIDWPLVPDHGAVSKRRWWPDTATESPFALQRKNRPCVD